MWPRHRFVLSVNPSYTLSQSTPSEPDPDMANPAPLANSVTQPSTGDTSLQANTVGSTTHRNRRLQALSKRLVLAKKLTNDSDVDGTIAHPVLPHINVTSGDVANAPPNPNRRDSGASGDKSKWRNVVATTVMKPMALATKWKLQQRNIRPGFEVWYRRSRCRFEV